jgi:hypothetical protein
VVGIIVPPDVRFADRSAARELTSDHKHKAIDRRIIM